MRYGLSVLLALAVAMISAAPAPAPATRAPRRIAIRIADGVSVGPDAARMRKWGRREGIAVDVGPESAPVDPGEDVVRLALAPPPESWRARLSAFPVRLEPGGFAFDGRSYRGPEDAVAMSDPARPSETLVLGNGERAAWRAAARAIFGQDDGRADYLAVSGSLTKRGRFRREGSALVVDRASDRDEIASRDAFERGLGSEVRRGVRWIFREAERPAVAIWEPVLERHRSAPTAGRLTIRLFPDASTKARDTGSSRPADLVRDGEGLRVDLDVSAPSDPDLVGPVVAAAALAEGDPSRASRATLLLARGARACGRWWGRGVRGFAAFLEKAGVEPTVEEVLRDDENLSPVLGVGAAASWLDAGARAEGDAAVLRILAAPEREQAAALTRWRERASREPVEVPARRPLPAGFLRGVSYAMSNSLDGAYVSNRSRSTLERLSRMSVDSVSVMPLAFSRDPRRPEIAFVHRSAQGETDEGTVRAVVDARRLKMTALVKPQIWLPGVFVGEVSMPSEVDWTSWFDAYRRFLVHHAIVAEAAGASLFCVGTELSGTEARDAQWRRAIAAARLATGAPLLYAANWAADAPRIGFWDALDAIGVDFYDPLSSDPAASDDELVAGARRAASPAAELSRQTGKPVVFAEVGYPPVRASWLSPHDEDSGRPPSAADAARAVAAVFRAFEHEAWWKGAYWWKVFSDGREARSGERGYNLLGTPSERAIAAAYARAAGSAGTP